MEFNGILVLAAIWFLLNLLTRSRRKTDDSPPPREPVLRIPPSSGMDPTQLEGRQLEMVLGQLQRSLEDAGVLRRPMPAPLPSAEEMEERASLETEPEVVSLEEEVRREVRRRVDLDEEAELVEARRIQAAAARDATRTRVNHTEFDQRIRQEPADHTATRGYTAKQLRDAVVWREILGPPVSER